MSFKSNTLTLRVFKQCFRETFCNGGDCEKYPCLLNHTNENTKAAITIKNLITSCPYFYDLHDRAKVNLDRMGKIIFVNKGGK